MAKVVSANFVSGGDWRWGASFDLVTGFDLTKADHQREVFRCMPVRRPLVILMGFVAHLPGIVRTSARCCTQTRGVNHGRLAESWPRSLHMRAPCHSMLIGIF